MQDGAKVDLARACTFPVVHLAGRSCCRRYVAPRSDASQTQQKELTLHLARQRYSEGPVMVVLAATKLCIALICAVAYSEAADQSEAGPLVQVNFYGRLDLLT